MEKVTALVLSYNHENYINETIKSIIDQDYQGDIEIIVVDDASSDNTSERLANKSLLLPKNRSITCIFKEKNLGVNDSIDRGLQAASGSLIQIIGSDDILCSEKIRKQAKYLQNSNVDCVYARGYMLWPNQQISEIFLDEFDLKLRTKSKMEFFVSTRDWGLPLAQSALFRRSLLEKLKNIRGRFRSDDWAMLIEIASRHSLGYLSEPLFYYRQHELNTHKRYNFTFPMRIEVISNLVRDNYKPKAYSNVFMSHAEMLIADGKLIDGLKFYMSSIFFKPSSLHLLFVLKLILPRHLLEMLSKIRNGISKKYNMSDI
jgi:alpha-1,3-rhamnosyltransferase